MDGQLLVLDSRTLPSLHALATVDVPVAQKAVWRHRTFPAMAALILATVLSLVYFVSTQRGVQSTVPAGNSITTPDLNPPAPSDPVPPPTTELSGAAVITNEAAKPEEPKPEPTKETKPTAVKKTSAKTPTTQSRTEAPKKDENKVGSILKKTGRILKKPFKF
jgi:hypothetical protein